MAIPVAIAYSPKTRTNGITLIGATTIVINNTVNEGIESFPAASVEAPGVAVMCTSEHFNSEDPADYETITYTERDVPTNELRGVTREVEGTVRQWPDETWIASYVSADAWNEIRGNVVDLIGHTEETVTGIFNVKTGFGAKGDNSTDDTTDIQNAINAAVANGAGVVFFPTGIYIVSNTLTVNHSNVSLVGTGAGSTIIKTSSATADIIVVGDGTTTRYDNAVKQLGIETSITRTDGAGIRTLDCRQVVLQDLFFTGMFNAITLNETNGYVDRVGIKNLVAVTGVGIDVTNGGNDQYISNVLIGNAVGQEPAAGIRLEHTNAAWLTNIDIMNCVNGLLIAPGAGSLVSWCFLQGVAVDQCTSYGLFLHAPTSTSVIKGITFEGCWSGSNNSHGVVLFSENDGVIDGVRFIGFRSCHNAQDGFTLNNGTNISLDACDISGNSTATSGTWSGVEIRPGLSGFSIRNCRSGQMAGFNNTQSRGIIVQAGASDDYIITNNDLRGNIHTGLHDDGTGTNKIIDNNLS